MLHFFLGLDMMTFADVIHAIAEIVVALSVLYNSWRSYKNGRAIEIVHKATNSLTDRLVATTATSSEAAGFEKGRQQSISEAKTLLDDSK